MLLQVWEWKANYIQSIGKFLGVFRCEIKIPHVDMLLNENRSIVWSLNNLNVWAFRNKEAYLQVKSYKNYSLLNYLYRVFYKFYEKLRRMVTGLNFVTERVEHPVYSVHPVGKSDISFEYIKNKTVTFSGIILLIIKFEINYTNPLKWNRSKQFYFEQIL